MATHMHIMHAYTLEEALEKAYALTSKEEQITIIPDGISVILK